MLKRAMVALLLAATSTTYAEGFDISLSNKAASIKYLSNLSNINEGGADIGFGAFVNENDDYIFNANFLVIGHPATAGQPWQFGVGPKAYIGSYDNSNLSNLDLGAIAIGGQLRYIVPNSVLPMAVALEGYFSPRISSFGDADKLVELELRYEFEIVSSTRAYVGYRQLKADFKTLNNAEFDDQAHVGIRVSFY